MSLIKKYWIIFLIVILAFFVGSKIIKKPNDKINTYKVKKQTIKEELSLSGKVDAEEKVNLRFQTSGRLVWVGVKEGDYVKKYQTIASLDQRDLKNRLTKYLNTYAKQRNSFEQTKDDYWNLQYDLSETVRNEVKRILENNQYDLNNSVLDVEYQNLSLEYANLWAPIEGIVTKVSTPYAGVNITPSGAEFEVINPKTLYFLITADQTEVINLKENMKGKIVFDSFPDEEIIGEIYWIGFTPKTDETGTVYPVKIKFETEKNLKFGMTGDINFVLKERDNVISIPKNYLKEDKKGKYVYKMINNKKIKQYVKIDGEIDNQVIILNGLNSGDIIYD